MINQFDEIMRFYEKIYPVDDTVLTEAEIQEQQARLSKLPIIMKEFNDFVNQLDEIDTSIENRDLITSLLIDTYLMLEKVSLEMAHMIDFCRDTNKVIRQKHEEHGDSLEN